MSEWISRWAGSYTFISCSYWAEHYSETLKRVLGKGFNSTLFIHKKGAVSFLVKKDELNELGIFFADKAINNPNETKSLLKKLKYNTDTILNVMNKLKNEIPTLKRYNEFKEVFEKHLAYHNFMKKTVDYLPKDKLKILLPLFQDARIYSESVYSKTEDFFRNLAYQIAIKESYSKESLTCLTKEELELYLQIKILPKEIILSKRYEASAILFENNQTKIMNQDELKNFEDLLFNLNLSQIKGTSAFKGKVIGKCKIINNPLEEHEFEEGAILVTGMTRPEFIPYLKKASAIVTDAGGILCHAAILAREMKLPCIIGTENATKILKDGDLIEVNAENGIVRKLEVINMNKTNKTDWSKVEKHLKNEELKPMIYDTKLINIMGFINKKRILDYGSGPAVQAKLFQSYEADVYTFDTNEKITETCKQELGLDKVYNSSSEIKSNYFDIVTCNLVLCINDEKEVKVIIKNIKNVLKDEGKAYIGFCNPLILNVHETILDFRPKESKPYHLNHFYYKTKKEGNYPLVDEYHRPISWYEKVFHDEGLKVIDRHFTESNFNGKIMHDFIIFELETLK